MEIFPTFFPQNVEKLFVSNTEMAAHIRGGTFFTLQQQVKGTPSGRRSWAGKWEGGASEASTEIFRESEMLIDLPGRETFIGA